jgi:muramoyltetrapeptide carboxypeptidase
LASKRKPTAVTPRFLNPGDTVGVVSPGFAVKPALLEQGLDRLRRMGYEVVVGDHVLARQGYLAGDDGQRAADLREMLRRPEVSAIWFARGGYGTARLLDRVPWAALRRDPKLLIGYSDLTALFNAVVDRTPAVCLYGPVVTELGDSGAWHAPSLRALTGGESLTLRLARRSVLVEGRSEGRLLGGNLSVLTHLVGTRFAPDFRDCILFLEETGEQTYRVDRMLTQLRQSGALRRVKGIVLGRITVPPRRRFPPDRSPDEVLRETFVPLGVPVVRDLPAGHLPGKRTLPLGARAILDTTSRTLSFEP